jgi:hypothetical protein
MWVTLPILFFLIYKENPWNSYVNREGIFYQVSVLLLAIFNMCVASYKLWRFIKVKGFELSVTQCCLALEFVANLCLL